MIFWSNKKFLKAFDLVLLFLKKKNCAFVLGMAHGDPSIVEVASKMVIFRGFTFSTFLFRNYLIPITVIDVN